MILLNLNEIMTKMDKRNYMDSIGNFSSIFNPTCACKTEKLKVSHHEICAKSHRRNRTLLGRKKWE